MQDVQAWIIYKATSHSKVARNHNRIAGGIIERTACRDREHIPPHSVVTFAVVAISPAPRVVEIELALQRRKGEAGRIYDIFFEWLAGVSGVGNLLSRIEYFDHLKRVDMNVERVVNCGQRWQDRCVH